MIILGGSGRLIQSERQCIPKGRRPHQTARSTDLISVPFVFHQTIVFRPKRHFCGPSEPHSADSRSRQILRLASEPRRSLCAAPLNHRIHERFPLRFLTQTTHAYKTDFRNKKTRDYRNGRFQSDHYQTIKPVSLLSAPPLIQKECCHHYPHFAHNRHSSPANTTRLLNIFPV